jgi:predicted O-methyltransferase YrrM
MSMSLPWRHVPVEGGPPILTSITQAETAVLRELAATAGEVVDIGSAYGYSAVVMAKAGTHVITIDPHAGENPDTLAVLMGNLQAYQANTVTVSVGTSQEVLPRLPLGWFGLVFIDGDHREPSVIHDVEWALKLLRPGGVLAAHDLDEATCPGVRAALDRLFDHPQPTVDTLFVHRT